MSPAKPSTRRVPPSVPDERLQIPHAYYAPPSPGRAPAPIPNDHPSDSTPDFSENGHSHTRSTGGLDELDLLVRQATADFHNSRSWVEFFNKQRDPRGDWADVTSLDHPAARLLDHYKRKGVPVLMSAKRWPRSRKLASLARGPHKSAKEHIEFLREEYVSMIRKGHWTLLPAWLLIDHPDLRLSPLGVVPQRDRRPRTISDYSYFGINEDTIALAPQEAMQFGRALHRLIQKVHDSNPRFGPVYLAKIDIADGFYRIGIRSTDALKLAVLFPARPGEEPLIGIPLTLPMGWKESPPAFCTATETVADLANEALRHDIARLHKAPHRLDTVSETPPPTECTDTAPPPARECTPVPHHAGPKLLRPLQYWDVYVDDFLALAQGNKRRRRMIKRALLHSLDSVFRPLETGDVPTRQEPASVKKLKKGDATWATRKVMLGWLIDTVRGTIELPAHRIERLSEILSLVKPQQKVVDEKEWHKVLGELRSMAIAIPGARGLFSLLQEALRHKEKHRPRIRLSADVHRVLEDFRWLAKDVASRPTRLAELLPSRPRIYGACDAAGTGMGGVFFVPDSDGTPTPFLWRERFPESVQSALVSFANPTGTINNSDLELCGNIAHHTVVADTADVREITVWTGSDNIANVCWLRKGSTTTTGPPAHLLRLQAHHQRYHRYVPTHDYVPGSANVLADVCSRAWHLSNTQLLRHFNTTYPQIRSWQLCHVNSNWTSSLISALFRKPLPMEFLRKMPSLRMPIGHFGPSFASSTTLIPSCATSKILSPSSKSLHKDIETVAYPPAVSPSQLAGYQLSSARWARRSNGWGPRTLD